MLLKSKKLTPKELAAYEAKRNIGEEILEAINEMKAGGGHVVLKGSTPPSLELNLVAQARQLIGLSQSELALALTISKQTLLDWEHGRRPPSGPAKVLFKIALKYPKIVLESLEGTYKTP